MLKLLREIDAPHEFRIAGSWIPASLLNQVADYRGMILTAHRHIEAMEQTAKSELEVQRVAVMKNAADSCRDDLNRITAAFEKRRKELEAGFAESCVEVTRMAVDQMIRSIPELERIEPLVSSLIEKVKSKQDLRIRTNPSQVALVEEMIAERIAEKFGLTSWSVIADPGVKRDRFVVDAEGNSYIDVSLENWLNLMGREIDSLQSYFESKSNSNQGRS